MPPDLTYTNFGVCDFSRLAVTDWRLRRWRLWFLALSNAPHLEKEPEHPIPTSIPKAGIRLLPQDVPNQSY